MIYLFSFSIQFPPKAFLVNRSMV